jgi:hypothetical protein
MLKGMMSACLLPLCNFNVVTVFWFGSYGAQGYRATSAEDFLKLLHECLFLSTPGVKLIEVITYYKKEFV